MQLRRWGVRRSPFSPGPPCHALQKIMEQSPGDGLSLPEHATQLDSAHECIQLATAELSSLQATLEALTASARKLLDGAPPSCEP